MKKLQQKTALLFLLFTLLLVGSCKKDQKTKVDDQVNDAKSWYLNYTSKSHTGLKLSSGSGASSKSDSEAVTQLSEELNWSKSKSYILDDGSELVSVPMSVNIDGKAKTNGSFMLLISKKSNSYSTVVAYNSEKDYFLKDFAKYEIENIYNVAVSKTSQKLLSKAGSSNKLKTRPPGDPICIDWYWIIYLEDAYGNPIEILSITYLYTTCEEIGGGGGGGDEPPVSDDFDFGQAEDGPETLLTAVPEEDEGGAQIEKRWYKWRFHTSYIEGFSCYSYEKGRVKKLGPLHPWQFIAFEHLSESPTGMSQGHEIEIITHDTQVDMSYDVTKFKIWYKIKRVGHGFGSLTQIYGFDEISNHKYYPNDQE